MPRTPIGLFMPFFGLGNLTQWYLGIGHYCQKHGLGSVIVYRQPWEVCQGEIRRKHLSGLIGRFSQRAWAEQAATLPFPVVSIYDDLRELGLPSVMPDDQGIGTLGAEHFLERGYTRFGFYGVDMDWSLQRESGFADAVREAGHECLTTASKRGPVRHPAWKQLARKSYLFSWLRRLRPPAAVMVCHDTTAMEIIEACQELGWKVPEDVAVLGVDNELGDEFCEVPLSSVDPNWEQAGYEAAALLHRLTSGSPAPDQPVIVPPGEVIVRRSSGAFGFENRQLVEVLQYVQDRVQEGIGVEDVLNHVPMSRSKLERLCRRYLKRSPGDEIHRVRLQLAKRFLLDYNWSLQTVAERAGFASVSYFCQAFQRHFRTSPGRYRIRHQSPG